MSGEIPEGYDVPRGASPADAELLGLLASTVFRGAGAAADTMPSQFPLLYAESNLPNFRIICRDSKPVSGVGIRISDALCLGHPFKIGSVGSVCTYEEDRDKGLATLLMHDAERHMRREGVDLVIVSGGRGLYRRMKYELAGLVRHYQVSAGEVPQGLSWREADDSDVGALAQIYARKPVRFRRPLEDFAATLSAFRFQTRAGPGRTVIAENGGRVTTYLSMLRRHRDGSLQLETSETGGDADAIIDLAAALARDEKVDSFDLAAPGAHEDLRLACERRGFASVREPENGTFKLLEPARFVDKMRPLFADRAGSEPASSLVVESQGDACAFGLHGERLDVPNQADLLRLLFEPGWDREELGGGQLGAFLAAAFPLPMIMPGFNYA